MSSATLAASHARSGAAGQHGTRAARGTVSLSRRRIYILPTRQGVGFAFMLFVMLLGAVNYNNSLAHVLVFTLASLALVSLLHTYRNMAGLRLRGIPSRAVFAGETAQLAVMLEEPGERARHDIVVRDSEPTVAAMAEAHLDVGETARAELTVPAPRRGWLRRDRVVIASRYPFGLFRAWSVPHIELACLVYPAPAQVISPLHDSAESEHDGDLGAAGEEDFAGLREYVEGDPLSRVHWKAAARSDELKIKRFEGAAPAEVQLDFDNLRGSTEARLSQLCAMVLEADANGMRYGLRVPGTQIAAGGSETHRHECLAALALFETPQ